MILVTDTKRKKCTPIPYTNCLSSVIYPTIYQLKSVMVTVPYLGPPNIELQKQRTYEQFIMLLHRHKQT